MNKQEEIANLVREVAMTVGYERAAVCSVDCLLQWRDGLLDQTLAAWTRFLKECAAGTGHANTDTNRHGAWVPAIPL